MVVNKKNVFPFFSCQNIVFKKDCRLEKINWGNGFLNGFHHCSTNNSNDNNSIR